MPRERTPAALAREANLTSECLICSGAAAAHQHYGAVCCYSCRAFFRRGITRNYTCVRGDNKCQVNSITRTNCKKCRYERCLEVGMRPDLVDASLKKKKDVMDEAVEEVMLEQHRHHHLQLQEEEVVESILPTTSQVPLCLPTQPIPQYQLAMGSISQESRVDSAILLQALEGKKKVLLELRDKKQEEEEQEDIVDHQEDTVMHLGEGGGVPGTVYMDPSRPTLHVGAQPVRQQTYYIFHSLTQTFEPVTIAEFLEQPAYEEVVVADDYEQGAAPVSGGCLEADGHEVQQATTYIEEPVDCVEESSQEECYSQIGVEEEEEEEGRMEDVESSGERRTGHVQFDQENEDHRIIQEYLRIQQRSLFLPRSTPNSVEYQGTPESQIEERGLAHESGDTPAVTEDLTSGEIVEERSKPKVDIEELVDLIFQEEMAKMADGKLPGIGEKPVLVVKPLFRENVIKKTSPLTGPTSPQPPHSQTTAGRHQPTSLSIQPGRQPTGIQLRSRPQIVSRAPRGPPVAPQFLPARPLPLNTLSALAGSGTTAVSTITLSPVQSQYRAQSSFGPRGAVPAVRAAAAMQTSEGVTISLPTTPLVANTSIQISSIKQGSVFKQSPDSRNNQPVVLSSRTSSPPPTLSPSPSQSAAPPRQFSVIRPNLSSSDLKRPPDHTRPAVPALIPICSSQLSEATSHASTPVNLTKHTTVGETDQPKNKTQVDTETNMQLQSSGDLYTSTKMTNNCPDYVTDQQSSFLPALTDRSTDNGCDRAPAVSRKRNRLAEGKNNASLLPLKKRRRLPNLQGFPVNLAINKYKVPFLKFSLEEEFILEELKQARQIIGASAFEKGIQLFPQKIVQYLSSIVSGSMKNHRVSIDDSMFDGFNGMLKSTLVHDGKLLFNSIRKNISDGLLEMLIDTSMPAVCIHTLAIFFHNTGHKSFIEQENSAFCMGDKFWSWCRSMVPNLDSVKALTYSDINNLASPWARSGEEEDLFHSTILEVGKIIGDDERLAALTTILVLLYQPQGTTLCKNKNLKNMRTEVATLMYRYLSHKEGWDEGEASRTTYNFIGLLQNLHRSADILLSGRLKLVHHDSSPSADGARFSEIL